MSAKDTKIGLSQVLLPLVIISFTLFVFFAFQMTQSMHDREALHAVKTQQDKPFEDVQKLQAQLSALALGTKELADGGDKGAQGIIAELNKAGISVGSPAAAPGAAAPKGPAAAAPAAPPAGASGTAVPVAPKPAAEQP